MEISNLQLTYVHSIDHIVADGSSPEVLVFLRIKNDGTPKLIYFHRIIDGHNDSKPVTSALLIVIRDANSEAHCSCAFSHDMTLVTA